MHNAAYYSIYFQLPRVRCLNIEVVVAEWLRRWTRNPLGSPRAGSNPADYVGCTFNQLFDESAWWKDECTNWRLRLSVCKLRSCWIVVVVSFRGRTFLKLTNAKSKQCIHRPVSSALISLYYSPLDLIVRVLYRPHFPSFKRKRLWRWTWIPLGSPILEFCLAIVSRF